MGATRKAAASRKRKRTANRLLIRRGLPRPGIWLSRHAQVALSTLGELARKPLGSLMTILVLGIALALPAGMLLTLLQVERIGGEWQQTASVTAFLQLDATDETARSVAASIEERTDVAAVQLVTREDALAEFRRYSGFGEALDALDGNPLPPVLLIQPLSADPAQLDTLVSTLEAMPETDLVQYDQKWLQRFRAITAIGQRAAMVLGVSLALAVLLIVGNTIRLEILNRQPEIEITKLVGATNAFIRRPFLYRGIWYGLAGGLAAWVLVGLALSALSAPVADLAGLYGSGFRLSAWHPLAFLGLAGAGIALGLGGAWIAVGRHLHAISPS